MAGCVLILIFSGQMLFLLECLFLNVANVNSLANVNIHFQRHAGCLVCFPGRIYSANTHVTFIMNGSFWKEVILFVFLNSCQHSIYLNQELKRINEKEMLEEQGPGFGGNLCAFFECCFFPSLLPFLAFTAANLQA